MLNIQLPDNLLQEIEAAGPLVSAFAQLPKVIASIEGTVLSNQRSAE